MRLRSIKGVGWQRFSHYDQVIEAARKGSGVAVGKWPHLSEHLRDGELVAPLGTSGEVVVGGFYLEISDFAQTDAADAFVGWLRAEAQRDAEPSKPRKSGPRLRRTG